MVETKAVTKPNDIRSLILSEGAKKQFALALPKHLTPDRFVRVALTAINKTPKLLQCNKESLLTCLLDCSQLGLEPDGRKAHLIPYGDKATLIIDYKGLVELARRSGEIADIHADIVCENDDFKYSFGTNGTLIHKPNLKDRGEPIAAYSYVSLKDGSSSYEVMNRDEVEAIHKRSKAASNGPWVTDWAEMAKKTVFRRHSKWLPVSSELFQKAMDTDYDIPVDIKPNLKPEVETPQAISEVSNEPPTEKVKEAEVLPIDNEPSTPAQQKTIHTLATRLKISDELLYVSLEEDYRVTGTKGLNKAQASEMIKKLSEQLAKQMGNVKGNV